MAAYRSVVTRKGQATIPANVRHDLGLEMGDHIEWEKVGQTYVVRKAESVVDRLFGAASPGSGHVALTPEQEREALAEGHAEEWRRKLTRQ